MSDFRSAVEILSELGRLSAALRQEAPPLTPSDRTLGRLKATVAKLSQPKKARPLKCPKDYVQLWNELGASRSSELSARAIRYLSWETDIAIRSDFQVVALNPERISVRSLQGLVRSVHRRWDVTVNTPTIGNLVVAISQYSGKNALIEKWKQGLQHILNQNGPKNFAGSILNHSKTWEQYGDEWGIEADSEFGNQVLTQCVALSLTGRDKDATIEASIRYVLPSKHWRVGSFKSAVQQMILASFRFPPQLAELLRNFIVDDQRLLDPRVPANGPNWLGISDAARDAVIQWLSAEDIQLFFDHVLPHRDDPHGRKPFWLRYKGKVKRSRPILSSLDESRWLANRETRGKRNFGKMEYLCDTSAFLLDFGRVMVIEFSKVGNAVYVYEHRDVPDIDDSFWSQAPFSLKTLKQRGSSVVHMTHTPLWKSNMRTLLAQYGIQPGN
jgi:hypothetical protein